MISTCAGKKKGAAGEGAYSESLVKKRREQLNQEEFDRRPEKTTPP